MWEEVNVVANEYDFVSEEEDGGATRFDVAVGQHGVEFILRDHDAQLVCTVDYEHNSVTILVVVLPQRAIPTLPGHVECSQCEPLQLDL